MVSIAVLVGFVFLFTIGCHGDGLCPQSQEDLPSDDDVSASVLLCQTSYSDDGVSVGDEVAQYSITAILQHRDQDNEMHKILIADSGNTRVIAFRGSYTNQQLIEQAMDYTKSKSRLTFKGGFSVYLLEYYAQCFSTLYHDTTLQQYLNVPGKRFIFTGHSLGGVLASILGLATLIEHKDVWANDGTSIITFGAPRIGNGDFAEFHDLLISPSRKLRFALNADFGLFTPPRWSGYRHTAGEIYMDTRYNRNIWTTCAGQENRRCSYGRVFFQSIDDHKITNYRGVISADGRKMKDKYGNTKSTLQQALWSSYCN